MGRPIQSAGVIERKSLEPLYAKHTLKSDVCIFREIRSKNVAGPEGK